MYHSAKNFTIAQKLLSALAALVFGFFCCSDSVFAAHLTSASEKLNGNLTIVSSDFPALPGKKELKKPPTSARIFQYDETPLGDRQPFLFVHGLRAEYWPCCRWGKLAKSMAATPAFNNRFKIYVIRYDSLARLEVTVPQFRQCVARLYQACQKRPITVMSLSMGGNLVYEGMLDKSTEDSIKYFFALGAMFHGSPIFCEDWLQYSIYRNIAFPWTRVDHSLDYKLYFHRNPSLLKDLRWDNADNSVPEVGKFRSLLPFGPHGNLTRAATINEQLIAVNKAPINHDKLVLYAGYFQNPYMLTERKRVLESTLLFPYTLLLMKIPAHMAREHPVLNMLNREIATIDTDKSTVERDGTRFVYQLNDGITPLVSALFVPGAALNSMALASESDLPKFKSCIDARMARVFRNVDHLTFIDGVRPHKTSSTRVRDQLNPTLEPKTIFEWLADDVVHADELKRSGEQLAKDAKPAYQADEQKAQPAPETAESKEAASD